MVLDRIDDYFLGAVAVLVAVALIQSVRVASTAFHRVFQVFLVLYLAHVVNGIVIAEEFRGILIHWYKIPYVVNAALVSLAFLYLHKLIQNETKWFRIDVLYALPPVLVGLIMLPFYGSSAAEKRAVWRGLGNHGTFEFLESIAAAVIVLTIIVLEFRQIRAYRRFRNGAYWSSNAAQSEDILLWIRFVNNVIGMLAVLALGYVALRAFGEVQAINGLFRIVFYATDLVFLIYIALLPQIFKGLPAEHVSKVKASDPQSVHVAQRIKESKAFLDPELSLYRLALEFGMAPPPLSQAIREQTDMNFSQLINKHRVDHCKQLLMDGGLERHTIEALGLMSGFASRASFYRAFQQWEHCSPKEWLSARKG